MSGEARWDLDEFLTLWFGARRLHPDEPSKAVTPLLKFNRPVAQTFDGDVEVLVVEQQGVWLWGRTTDGRYVERENEPGVSWRELDEREDEFWLHQAAVEAAINLPASRSAQLFDAATVAGIQRAATPLPCGRWTWPGTAQSMHYRGASVIMVCEDESDFWVVASAPTEAHLDWLDALELSWDELDTRLESHS